MTCRSGHNKTQIDYSLISANNRMLCKDCKVIPNEYLGTQDRLLVVDVMIKNSNRKKKIFSDPRVRW